MTWTVIRRLFRLQPKDQRTFGIDEEGRARPTTNTYSTVASLAGAAGSLARPLQNDDLLEIAREDVLAADYRIA